MASVHNVLRRAGSLIAGVRRMVGGDQDTAIERLGETLTPIINPWGLPEWAILRGERLYSVRTFQSAVAAEFSGLCIENPVGSNTIVVVDAVAVEAPSALSFFLEIMDIATVSATYGVVARPGASRDRRFRSFFSSVAQIRQGTDPTNTFGAQLDAQRTTTGEWVNMHAPPVVLRPGDLLAVIGQTVNVAINAVFVYRERSALPGELE